MNNTRILLIDDDESLCTLLTMNLNDAGYKVISSTEGEESLELIEEEVFNIIITDLRIDTVTGFDILTKAKRISPSTEVIMVTGHGSVEDAVDAMKQGAFNYITKPVDPDELNLVIQKALSILRKELEESEKKQDIATLNQIIIRIQSLERIRRELSIGLGGRAIIR